MDRRPRGSAETGARGYAAKFDRYHHLQTHPRTAGTTVPSPLRESVEGLQHLLREAFAQWKKRTHISRSKRLLQNEFRVGAKWSRNRFRGGPEATQHCIAGKSAPRTRLVRPGPGPRRPRAARVPWTKRTQLSRSKRLLQNEFRVGARWSPNRFRGGPEASAHCIAGRLAPRTWPVRPELGPRCPRAARARWRKRTQLSRSK
jgi:hypothetical protein